MFKLVSELFSMLTKLYQFKILGGFWNLGIVYYISCQG